MPISTKHSLPDPSCKKIILIKEDEIFCSKFRRYMDREGIVLSEVRNLDNIDFDSFFKGERIDAIILDTFIETGSESRNIINIINIIRHLPRVKVYIIMPENSLQHASAFLDSGASNIYPLSLGPEKIAEKISISLSINDLATHDKLSKDYSKLIGRSVSHLNILEQIDRMKNASASVLLTGETGTGKELVARALYEASAIRSSGKFEAINCGAIPENLLESELFGHKRGAFTDAKAEKKGLFEICSDGVLFLDEIGELPLSLQVKLLRVLEKEVRPLGASTAIKVNTRIIAATNRDLLTEVESGRFRRDLYYRLAILKIHIPPLRERVDDISMLVDYFIAKFSRENGKTIHPLTSSQLVRMKIADWPGNIRELQNSIERAVILSMNHKLDLNDIFETGYHNDCSSGNLEADISAYPLCHAEAKEVFEKAYLVNLLKSFSGNVTEAAHAAKKTRVEIYRYLSRNHIIPADFRH